MKIINENEMDWTKALREENEKKEQKHDLKDISLNLEIDTEMLNFLKQKTIEIQKTISKSYTEIGKHFYEAQKKLTGNNHYDGVFEKWYSQLGFSKRSVYNWINRYNLVVQFLHDKTKIEALPVTLTYEIANPKNPEALKNRVLSGEITTLKEYNDLKKKMFNLNNQDKQEEPIKNIEEMKNKFFAKMFDFKKENCKITENNADKVNKIFKNILRELLILEKLK